MNKKSDIGRIIPPHENKKDKKIKVREIIYPIDPIIISKDTSIEKLLSFYMGKNTSERQNFIIDNLKIDLDKA